MNGNPAKDFNFTAYLKTKLHPAPLPSGIIHRERLINKLAEGRKNGTKLILVSAPAGYGKSTLITDWLVREKLKHTWLSIEDEDNKLVPFFEYLISSLQEISKGFGKTIRSLLVSPQLPPINALISLLIQELEALPTPLTIVLDDYHFISNRKINQGISYLLEHLPLKFQLIIISRQDPTIPLGRLRANKQLTEIRMKDLKFNKQEASSFFKENLQIALNEGEVSLLNSRTEGWVSGLQLAWLSLKELTEEERKVFIDNFSGSNSFVIDYLFEEVLARQKPEVKEFLCKTSVLNKFNDSICNRLTEESNSKSVLAELDKCNHFIIPLDANKSWYRYHHLFREFLISELSLEEKKDLHRKAANWYDERGYLHEAIYHAREADDLDLLEGLIFNLTIDLFNKGEVETLLEYMEYLPEKRLIKNSKLLIFKSWCLFLIGKVKEISGYLQLIKDREDINKNDSYHGLFLALIVLFDHQEKNLEIAEKAVNMIDEKEYFFRIAALLSLGQVQASMGKYSEAVNTFKEAMNLGQKTNFHFGTITALINLAVNLNWLGQRKEAVLICENYLYEYTDSRRKLYPLANLIYIPLGILNYENNQLELAYRYLQKGITFCREWSFVRIMGLGEWYMGQTLFALGKKEEAIEFVEETIILGKQLGLKGFVFFMSCLESDLSLKADKKEKAFLWAEEIVNILDQMATISGVFMGFTFIRTLLSQRRIEEVDAILARINNLGVKGSNLITVRLLQTKISYLESKKNKALKYLIEAVKLARSEGYTRVFLDEGEIIYNLLPEVKDVSPAFINGILEAFDLKKSTLDNQNLIEPLSERELEILELVVNGLSNKEIAKKLYITVGTTKWHISNIYGKLGVNKRAQAIKKALQLELVTAP